MRTHDRTDVDVLVLDDEPSVASSWADILELAGFKVGVAGSVDEAQDLAARRTVRSVILDHSLVVDEPSVWPLDIAHRPAVILVSGLGRDWLQQTQAQCGHRLFAALTKPVPPDHLIDVVRAAVAQGD